MRASLEVRTPFLSRNLYNTLAKYDQRAFIAFGSKSVLRRILDRYLPKTITNRPKQGFNYPQSAFLAHFTTRPQIPNVPQTLLQQAWDNKDNHAWQALLIRLAILDHFSTPKTHANTTTKIQCQPTSC